MWAKDFNSDLAVEAVIVRGVDDAGAPLSELPASAEADVLKIAVSLPRREAVSNGDFIPLEKLEVSLSEG
ncbi:MAG: hypothetical protein ACPG77_20455, partial [Nannocystaceae bacterium]